MHNNTRAVEMIKIAFNNFNLKEDKELYGEIIAGIERTERVMNIRFNEKKLIRIIKAVHQLLKKQGSPSSLGAYDAKLQEVILQIVDVVYSRRFNEALSAAAHSSLYLPVEVI